MGLDRCLVARRRETDVFESFLFPPGESRSESALPGVRGVTGVLGVEGILATKKAMTHLILETDHPSRGTRANKKIVRLIICLSINAENRYADSSS